MASTAVRKLEDDVGVRLLHRTTRSVQLTEGNGRGIHARARDLLAEVDDLHSMFASDRVALRGRLRVDLPTEVARMTIVPALPDFMAAHPQLELEVSSTDRQVDLVQEGFDCVLRLGPIGDETLIARPLGKLRTVNAASPAYLARHGVPRSLEDLQRQGHRTIHFTTMLGATPQGMGISGRRSDATLQLPGALHVNSAQTYEAAALAGLGLIQAPLLGVGRYLESGALVEIIPDFRRRPLDVSLVVAHRSNLSRRVRAFMKWIKACSRPTWNSETNIFLPPPRTHRSEFMSLGRITAGLRDCGETSHWSPSWPASPVSSFPACRCHVTQRGNRRETRSSPAPAMTTCWLISPMPASPLEARVGQAGAPGPSIPMKRKC